MYYIQEQSIYRAGSQVVDILTKLVTNASFPHFKTKPGVMKFEDHSIHKPNSWASLV